MDDEILDLIGPAEAAAPVRRRRPVSLAYMRRQEELARREEAAARLAAVVQIKRAAAVEENTDDVVVPVGISDVQHGVTVGTLATIFSMDPTTVRQRLRDCVPIQRRKTGFVYDLKSAAQYLVKPVFDASEYIQTMKASELPTHLQKEYWSAMTSRQQWEKEAGHLWRTEQVLAVFGDVFQAIKFALQLWPDNVERAVGLTEPQRVILTEMADELQKDIHAQLLTLPAKGRHGSTVEEFRVAAAGPAQEDETDVSDLI